MWMMMAKPTSNSGSSSWHQDEAKRLYKRVTELECVSGQTTVIKSQKSEPNQTIEELELDLRAKEEELEQLEEEVQSAHKFQSHRDALTQKLKAIHTAPEFWSHKNYDDTETRNLEREAFRKRLRSQLELLDTKIFELTELRDTMAKLIKGS
ncbi:unnamed protein product [Pleuronectes platessa]|uniref:Uncharacterized protein n=1 Tax=Pleuronectes platessa TaxID=8262 RepID=A0A9N7UN11_PLEPL|nr:unnamed protein product [Pleuronectes platessa]